MTLKRNSIRTPNIVEFVTDPQLLGLTISEAQETLLRAIYGLPMPRAMQEVFFACTGRQDNTGHGFGETTVVAGARAGKERPFTCIDQGSLREEPGIYGVQDQLTLNSQVD